MPLAATIVPAIVAAALALLATPVVRTLALRLDAIDRGDDGRCIPRLGGLAVLAGLLGALAMTPLLGVAVEVHGSPAQRTWLAAGIAVITGAGVYDDLRGLRAPGKLALELVAALLVLAGGLGIAGMTNPLTGAYVEFGAVAAVVTLLWILFITNAFNLIDGLDGLAAGVGVIASAMLLMIALAQGRLETVPVWSALAGALVGFLVYNFPPASIFLGDTGSLLTGFLVAVLAIESVAKGPATIVVLAPVIVLGLPIADVVLAIVRRTLAAGPRGIVRRDREHLHHRIVRAGLSMRDAVLVLYAVCTAGGALAVAAVLRQGMANGLLLAVTIAALWIGVRLVRPFTRPR